MSCIFEIVRITRIIGFLFPTFINDETTFLIEDNGSVPIHTRVRRFRTVSRIDSLESETTMRRYEKKEEE